MKYHHTVFNGARVRWLHIWHLVLTFRHRLRRPSYSASTTLTAYVRSHSCVNPHTALPSNVNIHQPTTTVKLAKTFTATVTDTIAGVPRDIYGLKKPTVECQYSHDVPKCASRIAVRLSQWSSACVTLAIGYKARPGDSKATLQVVDSRGLIEDRTIFQSTSYRFLLSS